MSSRDLVGSMTIAVIVSVIFAWGIVERAAHATESREVSAGEQLRLNPEDQGQLVQKVVTSKAGDELFGINFDGHNLTTGECKDAAQRGYLGFRRPRRSLRLLDRIDALATPPVIGDGREALAISTPNCSTKQESGGTFNDEPLEHLQLLRGTLGRRPTLTTVLSHIAEPGHTAIAANPGGQLAVAWLVPHGYTGSGTEVLTRLHISIGHTSGSMGHTNVLGGSGFVTGVRLAWVGRHELLVVYSIDSRVVVQTWRPSRGFGKPQTLGRAEFNFLLNPDLAVAVGPSGRAAIAWGTQRDGVEPESPWKVFAAVRSRASARFGTTYLLDPGAGPDMGYADGRYDVTARIGANGFATIAWSSEQGEMGSACAMVVDPSGHFNSVQNLAPESSAFTMTETQGGGTLLQWTTLSGLGQATRQPTGESFGPAIASTSNIGLIDGAELIDSATGA